MNRHPLMQIRPQAGVGLVELMVALVLSLFLLAGLFTIFFSTRTSYNDQQALAALQDNQTLAASVLANTIRAAGYYPYGSTGPTFLDRAEAFPVNGSTWAAAGQVVFATGSTVGPDTLLIRLMPSQALNCLGQNNAGLGLNSTAVQVNTFELINTQASPNSLACKVVYGTGASLTSNTGALVSPLGTTGINSNGGGVQNLQVMIGVAPTGGSVQQYYAPSQMTAADWPNARSLIVTLTFFNPLFNAAQTPAGVNTDARGQPRYLKMTRVIRLENLAQ